MSRNHLGGIAVGLACWFAAILPAHAESLEEAWSIALTVDQQLLASQWQSSAAQRGLFAARAERWPSLDGRAIYYTLDKPVGVVANFLGSAASFDFLQREGLLAGVHVRQPLYTFGRIRSGIDAAGAEVAAAVSNEATSRLDILLRVSTAYIRVLKAQRAVETAGRAVESLSSHVRDVRHMVEQGAAVVNDQLAAEVSLSDARQSLLQAQARLDMAKAAYNRILGRALDTPVQLEELAEPAGTYDLAALTERALATRPEIAVLSAKTQALRSQAESIYAGYKPQFSLEGGVDYIENRYFRDEVYSSIMLMGQWNVMDSGRKRHQAAKLEQTAEALLRRRNDLESMIRLQVHDAWRNLQTLRERVRVNRSATKSADENLRVARIRYEQGAGTNTEVLDAETIRTKTYHNYHESRYDAVQALIQLSRAVGDFGLAAADLQSPASSGTAAPNPPTP